MLLNLARFFVPSFRCHKTRATFYTIIGLLLAVRCSVFINPVAAGFPYSLHSGKAFEELNEANYPR